LVQVRRPSPVNVLRTHHTGIARLCSVVLQDFENVGTGDKIRFWAVLARARRRMKGLALGTHFQTDPSVANRLLVDDSRLNGRSCCLAPAPPSQLFVRQARTAALCGRERAFVRFPVNVSLRASSGLYFFRRNLPSDPRPSVPMGPDTRGGPGRDRSFKRSP